MSAGASLKGPGCQKRQYFGGCCTSAALPVMLRSADSGWHTSWCTWLLHHRCHVAMTVRTFARMQRTSCGASYAGRLHFLQMRNSHLSTEDSGLYKSRRPLVKLALYKCCLILAAGFLGANMLRAAEHKVSMLYPVDLHQTAFQQACVVLWER